MTDPALIPFFAGFGLGGSLIVAIGAQNAFILRQGLLRRHVFVPALVCALSEAVLIWAGACAVSAASGMSGAVAAVARFGGAAFLLVYGLIAARRAFLDQAPAISGETEEGLARAVLVCLAFTWGNPHVYLDTVVLVGSVASQYAPDGRMAFCFGATMASVVWFFGLGYGARLLTPVFARPIAWRVLDAAIAVIMLTLGAEMAIGG